MESKSITTEFMAQLILITMLDCFKKRKFQERECVFNQPKPQDSGIQTQRFSSLPGHSNQKDCPSESKEYRPEASENRAARANNSASDIEGKQRGESQLIEYKSKSISEASKLNKDFNNFRKQFSIRAFDHGVESFRRPVVVF